MRLSLFGRPSFFSSILFRFLSLGTVLLGLYGDDPPFAQLSWDLPKSMGFFSTPNVSSFSDDALFLKVCSFPPSLPTKESLWHLQTPFFFPFLNPFSFCGWTPKFSRKVLFPSQDAKVHCFDPLLPPPSVEWEGLLI